MLLCKYDLYDVHAVLTAIRCRSNDRCNCDIIRTIHNIVSAPQKSNTIEPNIIRLALRKIEIPDKNLFHWVYVDNVYTFGWEIIKSGFCYSFLSRAFSELLECAEGEDCERLSDLADTLHNVPIFLADGTKSLKSAVSAQFKHYNKKYNTNLWKKLSE